MKFAEKLVQLRKQQGWSQEELADRLEVTRQSVSKWESAACTPDLEKVVKLSELFGVTTDYLLKDENLMPAVLPAPAGPEKEKEKPETGRRVSMAEANTFLELVRDCAGKMAAGVALCITSPALLLILGGLSEQPGSVLSGNMASGLGVAVLLLMIAGAVALFISQGMKLQKFEYLDKESLQLEYGAASVIEERMEEYAPVWKRKLVLGVTLCIVAVVPLMLVSIFSRQPLAVSCSVALLLVLVALGVLQLVHGGMIWDNYQKLLERGEYTREKKKQAKRDGTMASIYWAAVVVVYLAYSFMTARWGRSWIIWPIAGCGYALLAAIVHAVRKH